MDESQSEIKPGDKVAIVAGNFENFEATVSKVLPDEGMAVVLLRLFYGGGPPKVQLAHLRKIDDFSSDQTSPSK